MANKAPEFRYVVIVDEAGNPITSGNPLDVSGSSGGTSATDDAAFTAGSGSGTPIMGFATSDSVDAGDVGVLAMDTARNLKVSIEVDNAGIGGGTQYTEDAVAASDPVGNALIMVRDDALSGQTTTDGDNVAARGTDKGELYVKHVDAIPVTDNSGSLTVDGTVAVTHAALTELGDAINGSQVDVDIKASDVDLMLGTDFSDVLGTSSVIGAGTEAGAIRVTVATDSTGVLSVDDNGGSITVDNAALTELAAAIDTEVQVDIVGALPGGTSIIGATVSSGHATAGTGLSTVFDADGDNTAQAIKTGAGRLYLLEVQNPTDADAYIQLFDAATGSVTVGSTTPKASFLVPAGDGTLDGAFGFSLPIGMHFGTAITYACTTTATGSGDPATGLIVNAGYV